MAKKASKGRASKHKTTDSVNTERPVAQTSSDPVLTQDEPLDSSCAIPRLKICPLTFKQPDSPDPGDADKPESPRLTPPPPIPPKELRKKAAAAVEALLGLPPRNNVRASKASSTLGSDHCSSEPEDGRVTPQKRKRAISEASEPGATSPDKNTLDEVDKLDQDQESSKSDSGESDEAVLIQKFPFSVPVDSANTMVQIPSNRTFKHLMSELADVLSVVPKEVKVAYCFSIKPCSAPWLHLKNDNDLKELFKKAFAAIAKQKKQRSTCAFSVELKDLASQTGSGVHDRGKGKNKSKKDNSRKQKKSCHNSNLDDSNKDLDPSTITSKKKTVSQWIIQLQKDNACDEHPNEACVKFTTHHHQLTKQELGSWAIYLTHDYPSTTTPPRHLKLGDQKPASKKPSGPSASGSEVAAPSASPNPFGYLNSQMLPMVPPALYPGYGYNPFPYSPPVMPGFAPHSPQAPYASSHRQYCGSGHQYDNNIPSSDPADKVEDITLFPRISEWLSQLDIGPRGVDGHNFSQFIPFFEEHKYICICDIVDMTSETLLAKCNNMANGTAQKIISYAKLDTNNICRKDKQQHAMKQN